MKQLAVTLLFCGVSAFAANVSYYTTGVFSGTDFSGGNLVNGGANISFQGAGSAAFPMTVTANPWTTINLGQFTVTDPTDVAGNFAGNDAFTLTVWQTLPAGGGGAFSSSITGTVTESSDTIVVTFSPTSLLIGGDLYSIPYSAILVPPGFAFGVSTTTIAGTVTIPEPASLALLGAALTSLGIAFRRRIA